MLQCDICSAATYKSPAVIGRGKPWESASYNRGNRSPRPEASIRNIDEKFRQKGPREDRVPRAAILARQDHCAERGPPKLSLCERAQSSCGGGETHVREAPPHATGGRGLPIFAKKKPRTRRGQSSLCGDLGHREKLVSHRNAIAGFQPRLSRTQARPLEGNTLPFTWHAGQPIQSPIASMSRRNAPTAGSS